MLADHGLNPDLDPFGVIDCHSLLQKSGWEVWKSEASRAGYSRETPITEA
jgi:hypothetical protein